MVENLPSMLGALGSIPSIGKKIISLFNVTVWNFSLNKYSYQSYATNLLTFYVIKSGW